jgi:hypothetical protein
MRRTIDDNPPPTNIRPIDELFTGAVTGLWVTSYGIDLALFNEFLLARLGEPPLNIAVLVDHRRLAASLGRVPAERADTLAAVNRRWLLRSVSIPSAFHPKSYLAVTGDRAKLLVGSGNLSGDGLNDGLEVFTVFRSDNPIGAAAIATWHSWMRRLITMIDNTALATRFQDLERHLPSAPSTVTSAAVPTPLIHNLDVPIADQLVDAIVSTGARVEELWLSAPFYDHGAEAVGALLAALSPRRVTLLISQWTNVDGPQLIAKLNASGAPTTVLKYETDEFVHAKLIGVIAGPHAWLLSGSANLSRAALTLTPHTGGNIELAILTPLDPDQVRATFVPHDMEVAEQSLTVLTNLEYRSDPEPELPQIRLTSAVLRTDSRVEISINSSLGKGWLLHDLTDRQPLIEVGEGRAVTAGPVTGRLVQIVTADGQALSNRMVVDDPAALAYILTAGAAQPGNDRPIGLIGRDLDSTLGRELHWLHQNLIMDISERDTTTITNVVNSTEPDSEADDDLWSRLEREQLEYDPRSSMYAHMWAHHALDGTEPIIQLLDLLRPRTPFEPTPQPNSLLALLLNRTSGNSVNVVVERAQRPSANIRVRARNLLRRWAAAQTDPRLLWIDPLAPAKNFATIAGTLAHLRLAYALHPNRIELTAHDLDELWQQWLQPIVGTGQDDGWLDGLDNTALADVSERIPGWLPEVAAALCWISVRPGTDYRTRVIAAKPTLNAAFTYGLLNPTEMTARYLSAITGERITRAHVDERLLEAAVFIDDSLWCINTAEDLTLDKLTIETPRGSTSVQTVIGVQGIEDPLIDPRIPRLVIAARHYRHREGIAVRALNGSWRLVFNTGETIAYLATMSDKSEHVESALPLTNGMLEQLAAAGGVLAELMPL